MSTTFAERRERFLEAIGDGVAVFPSAPVMIRNNDVEHGYRQDSDFYYLTGFDEPESVLVLTNQHAKHRAILFVRPRNEERETWDGPRAGVDGARTLLGVDATFSVEQLAEKLPDYLADVDRVHVRIGRGHPFDERLFAALDSVRRRARRGVRTPTEIIDPGKTVHEMRLRKDPSEIEAMRKAAEITRQAHLHAMKHAAPGRHEYEVAAEIHRVFGASGCERSAYESIVGSGPNACILHYRSNARLMEDGDLLLIDAGCEFDYYACDVTRTFPINGSFTPAQRTLYEVVLAAQNAAIDAVRPGVTLDELHDIAAGVIAEGLLEHGLLKGTLDEIMDKQSFKTFYMHRTSHWLGMDVHDVGIYHHEGAPRPLEPGFVLTIEPGIYVAPNADVPEQWRGIGIRIEDDILVTEDGYENLTAAIPKTVAEIEAAVSAN